MISFGYIPAEQLKYVQEQGEIFYHNDQPIKAIATLQDITNEQRPRELAAKLTHDFAHLKGKGFFEAVSQYIAELMGVDYTYIGLPVNNGKVINVAGGWVKGSPMEDFKYDLLDTPCANVLDNKPCIFPQAVQSYFPKDELLTQMGIESYVGVPLLGAEYEVIGIFTALHSEKMPNSEAILYLLQLAATQVSSEILRQKALFQLQTMENRFHRVASQNRTFLWDIDGNGLYIYCGEEVERVTGYKPEELVGKKHFYALHPAEGLEEYKKLVLTMINTKQTFNNFDNKIVTKDGELIWVSTSGTAVTNDQGNF